MTKPSITAILASAALAVVLITSRPGLALVAGDLDPTFGTGGGVGLPAAVAADGAIVVRPDGKVLVPADGTTSNEAGVIRLDTTGAPDATFGTGGFGAVDLGYPGGTDSIALAPDGKVVVSGIANLASYYTIVVARLDATGAPDPGFGASGVVITDLGSPSSPKSVAVQSDGKVVVVGARTGSTDGFLVLLRYNVDGSPDLGFGSFGVVEIATGIGGSANPRRVAVQADGKIVVGGLMVLGGQGTFLTRFDATGALDPTFGTGGLVALSGVLASSVNDIVAMALQPDGKIVVGGEIEDPNTNIERFLVARVLSSGALDTSFGGGTGAVTTAVFTTGESRVRDVAIQGDGKILAVGWAIPDVPVGSVEWFAMVRYNPDGSRDTTFGSGGIVSIPAPGPSGGDPKIGRGVAIAPDGKILAASEVATVVVNRFIGIGCSSCLKPLLKLGKLTTPGGDDTLRFKGTATLPTGPVIDPLANGVRVRVAGLDGTVLSDVTIPGGAGWTVNAKGNTWKWKSIAGVGGLNKITVKKYPADPVYPGNPMKFAVVGKTGSYGALPNNPMRARLILDQTSPEAGQCAEPYFPENPIVPNCVLNGSGSTLTCK